MGNENSKSSTTRARKQQREVKESSLSTETGEPYDRELLRIRRNLEKDQQAFLLNNLMLSVQFFENYDKEILDIRSVPISQQEYELNSNLSRSQKHVLLPDVLQKQVARHVKCTSTRLTEEATIEPIKPVRMYVVLDNIDVRDTTEEPKQSLQMDVASYKMCLELSTTKGYVKLRSLGMPYPLKRNTRKVSDSDLSYISKEDDGIYVEADEDVLDLGMNPTTSASISRLTRSMDDLSSVAGMNEEKETFSSMSARSSQTNLDDVGQDNSYGQTSERRFSGRTKLLTRLQLRRPSTGSSSCSSSSCSGYKSGSTSSESNYVFDSDLEDCGSCASYDAKKVHVTSSGIPISCFKKIVYTRQGKVYSENSERIQIQNRHQRRIRNALLRQNEDRLYFRSDKFRNYFQQLFVNRLARPLGLDIEDIGEVSRQGATIYCETIESRKGEQTLVISHKIAPSISTRWPECGRQWSNQSLWPTTEMIQKIKEMGCHIIPEASGSVKERKLERSVEWKFAFPEAERYLESSFGHSQARVYLMALMLHRNFMSPVDTAFGLTTSHIRSQLFWLIEQNSSPSMWPEFRSGECLRVLLKKLYSSVSQSQPYLSDYFVNGNNVFENIPRSELLLSQKQLSRIVDNPVMYLIASLANLQYKPEFFPVLDYKRLYDILTIPSEDLVVLINPVLGQVERPMSQARKEDMRILDEKIDRIGGFWGKVKTTEYASNEWSQKSVQHKNSINNEQKVASKELVFEITHRCADLDGLRLVAVLEVFIQHFAKMAEHSFRYGAMEQKDNYLVQAARLSLILYDQDNGRESAKRHLDTIDTLRRELRPKIEENIFEANELATTSVPFNQFFTFAPEVDEPESSQHHAEAMNDRNFNRDVSETVRPVLDLNEEITYESIS